jgi:hypothetical protein
MIDAIFLILKEMKSKAHLIQLLMIYYQTIRKRKIKYLIVFVTNGNNFVLLKLPPGEYLFHLLLKANAGKTVFYESFCLFTDEMAGY